MKIFPAIICSLIFALGAFAQTSPEILAAAGNQNFTTADLPANVRESYENLPQITAELRKAILNQMIADLLLDNEAKLRKTTVEKLVALDVKAKVPAPNAAAIQAVYDENRQNLGDQTLAQVKPQIVAFLRREPEQKALTEYIARLRTKGKIVTVKDVNSPDLKLTDVLTTVGVKPITFKDLDAKAKPQIYDAQIEIYDQARAWLDQTIYSSIITTEAKSQNLAPGEFIAREITNKLKTYTPEESAALADDLRERLYRKYDVKVFLKEPEPFVQNISIDDDPAQGAANAPVTVVMFSDFQCSHCAAAHPVLQSVMAQYADKVRFVVRDFPLVTIHKDAFLAAEAADAANAQGKFFEYIELLYQNQDHLDAASLKKFAAALGLNQKQFDLDLTSGKFAAEVKKDVADGESYGVQGTPTIFVGGVKVRNVSAEGFKNAIENALARAAKN